MRIPNALLGQSQFQLVQPRGSTPAQRLGRTAQLQALTDGFVQAKQQSKTLNVPQMDQGDSNACGTTSLAMISTFLGRPVTREQIDASIRNVDIGSAPDNLVSWARANGLEASYKNEASFDDITRMIDAGLPPMALIDPGSSTDFMSHYVVVSGYERGADGKVSKLHITDPEGSKYTMTADEFMKQWDNIKYGGIESGDRRLLLSFAPKGSNVELPSSTLGADLRNQGIRNLIDGTADFLNGWKNGRVGDIIGGAIETLASVPGYLIGKIPLPGFKELGGAINKVVDTVVEPIKKVGNAIASGVKSAAKAVGNFFKSLF
ncbi:MAG: C39 family peptidase [Myxococcaceae bacterium]|nr:C39 family peptidase [Myxococcaceae bacterium]